MVHVQATITIQASPAEVFRLLCDPELKTRLNPDVELLHAAPLTPGPMCVGSRIFYSIRVPDGARSFHCEVTAFEHNRLIEWRSDTQPAFRVRQGLEPTSTGCRLVHDEWLDTVAPAPATTRGWSLADIAQAFRQAAGLDMPTLTSDAETDMQRVMQERLGVWLENIRAHLETARCASDGDIHAIATVAF